MFLVWRLISAYHWLKSVSGTITKFLPSFFFLSLLLSAAEAIKAAIITVFPKPISSARIPPKHLALLIGGLTLT